MNNTKIHPARVAFNEQFKDANDTEILKEILYLQKVNLEKNERIRSNTSTLVWFLIAIPIIITTTFILLTS